MAEFVYVDNSNVFIEGQRASAVAKGMAGNICDAIDHRVLDFQYRLDFGRLYEFAAGDDPSRIRRAVLFGSRPPDNDRLWSSARSAGFEVVVEDRNLRNREKKIDTGLTVAMTRDAYTVVRKEVDTVTLIAGDADYVPAVRALVSEGYEVVVMFWAHASRELRQECSRFISLDPYLGYLGPRPARPVALAS